MRRLGWWLTWVKAICLKGPKKTPQHLKMNGFLRGVSLTYQIELQPKIITIGSDVCLIKKLNNKTLPHIVGPECSRSMQNPGLSLWASTMTAWGASRIRWRLMLHPKKKKSPFETITFVKGKGGFTGLWLITRTWHIKVGCGTGQTPQLSPKKCLEVFTVSLYCSNILNLDVTGKKMHSHIVEISEGQKMG